MRKPHKNAFLSFSILIVLVALTSQRGGMARFCPFSLAYEVRSERTIFATSIPIYRSSWVRVENPLISQLVGNSYISPAANKPVRWDDVYHWNESWRDGHSPLYNVLCRNADQVWAWSQTNPERARFFWTKAIRLLRSDQPHEIVEGHEVLSSYWRFSDTMELATEN